MDRKAWTEPFDAQIVAESLRFSGSELLCLDDAQGAVIFVASGSVWLTQAGEVRDRVMGPGQFFRLDRAGTAVLQAVGTAIVTITAAADVLRPAVRIGKRIFLPGAERGVLRSAMAWWLRLHDRRAGRARVRLSTARL